MGIKGIARLDGGTIKMWRGFRDFVLKRSDEFSAHQISGIIWAFSRVQYKDDMAFWNEVRQRL